MVDSATGGEKRPRTNELLEPLMLRMDAMDQAIASVGAPPAASSEQKVWPNLAAPMTSEDLQATPVLVSAVSSATLQEVVWSSKVSNQIALGSALVPTANSLPVVPAVVAIDKSVAQQDVVEHLASILPWLSEVGML
ncbi:hypothetical protein NDU88_010889 [Pleurodeles waltl]|uniref:Uncharacterized protein n=1 Tax=Pleurodeles waltl TaxID=8319 RepID=A0AAV7QVM5_PLEWA|nr:hypothetical protein NDU88_010889 [Pleurodeles waltl]